MSFLHNHSAESVSSALDLWALPPSQTGVLEGNYVQYQPVASLDDATVIEFNPSSSSNEYIDLAHCLIYIKAKIVGANGANIAADAEVAPVNNFLHSLFSQVDVSLNNKLVSQSGQPYHYRAYISNLLNYSMEAKDTHLTAGLWYEDTPGKMSSLNSDENTGYGTRKALAAGSRTIELLGPIHSDIFNQDRFLLNNINMSLKFYRSKAAFALMSNAMTENIKLLDARLLIRKVKISPEIMIAHSKALEVSPCKLPITRVDIKSFTIAQGLQSRSIEWGSGVIPKRLILGLVSNKAYNGDFKENPFRFDHFNLNYLAAYVDSQQVPSRPLTPNFAAGEYLECYYSLFTGTGIHFSDSGNAISRSQFQNGFTVYALDLTPCMNAGQDSWDLQRQANIRLELRFAAAVPEALNLIVVAEYPNLIQIDKQRTVIVDYAT
jgi:hypothetical protein